MTKLYPRPFRHQYGEEMEEIFLMKWAERNGNLTFWLSITTDWADSLYQTYVEFYEDLVLKKFVQLLLSCLIGLAFLLSMFAVYINVGPTLLGPKTNVENVCSMVEPGMDLAEAKTIVNGRSSVDMIAPNKSEIYSEQQGEFLCVCQVSLDSSNQVESHDVFCLD